MVEGDHEEVGIARGHWYAYSSFLDLEVMLRIEGKVIVGEDKLDELDKELSGW